MVNERAFAAGLGVKRGIEDQLLDLTGVHGVSLGYKISDGKPTDVFGITVHVTEKRPLDVIPDAERVPSEIDGVPTDIIVHPQARPHADEGKYRPLRGGCQLQVKNWLGTLGCFVRKGGTTYLLTNQHVLPAGSGTVWQPTNQKHNDIGTAVQAALTPLVDAAIGSITTSWTNSILQIGQVSGSYNITPADIAPPGYPVRKRGRTTGLTSGRVTGLNFSGTRTDGWVFRDQLFINSSIGDSGDSGSALVNNSNQVVGLYWGGNSSIGAGSTIANVMAALGVQVVAGAAASSLAAEALSANAEAAAVVGDRALLGHLQESLPQPAAGAAAEFASVVFPGIGSLIDVNPRMAAMWEKNNGHDLVNAVFAALQQGDEPLPKKIGKQPTKSALDGILDAAKQYGDAPLAQAIDEVRPYAEALLKRSLNDIVADGLGEKKGKKA